MQYLLSFMVLVALHPAETRGGLMDFAELGPGAVSPSSPPVCILDATSNINLY